MPVDRTPPPVESQETSLLDLDNGSTLRRNIIPLESAPGTMADDTTSGIMSRPSGISEINAVWKQQLPAFMCEAPDVWFVVIEAEFSAARVTSDDTKYLAVLRALDASTLRLLTDVLRNPPEKGKYVHLKQAILNRMIESRSKQVDKLLRNLTLGDKKPSQLLREMRDLAKGDIGADILHQLWLERLPAHVRPQLLTSNHFGLDGVAELADRLLDVFSSSYAVAATSSSNSCNERRLEQRLDEMQALILNCMQEIKELKLSQQTNDSKKFRQRPRSRSKTPARRKLCYYHERFGKQAKKCEEHCILFDTFKSQPEN
ncbi:uncharacterized protein [Prorops nasuta]|uniref:uncharacterized protein n=1 Tax=Prorops nasuta TaxID=863751 RepID=UPI0034CE22F2